ncbi:hypothetical protein [Falsiroseomonas selenitidurans]|uniref:Uncharacterized protein n=1 Tax=Falsiroseomonas selenitidurans TaxID=2716335 RepID=A0ABX1DZ90_9PROT|nr:hypothetical protein [Falsiroseomonas selenitidurans]NKC30183.1 hypothetical protein [Falsiroseomonas selenitidurans]
MSDALPLDLVTSRIRTELVRERAAGNPLKAAYHAVARRLGITARRVRAYHHGEVEAEEVRALELIAADAAWRREIETIRARITALEGCSREEARHGDREMAARRLDAPGGDLRGAGRALAAPAHPLAGLVAP